MRKISIRNDLYNQYINNKSLLTFKELEENYNNLIDLINASTNNIERYVICLISSTSLKCVKYCVNNKLYTDLKEASKDCNDLNFKNTNLSLEYKVELVQDAGITKLVKLAYDMLK